MTANKRLILRQILSPVFNFIVILVGRQIVSCDRHLRLHTLLIMVSMCHLIQDERHLRHVLPLIKNLLNDSERS